MTLDQFNALGHGDRVKPSSTGRPRRVAYVYNDPCGARIISLTPIQGCTKSIDNLDYNSPSHYSNWRLA